MKVETVINKCLFNEERDTLIALSISLFVSDSNDKKTYHKSAVLNYSGPGINVSEVNSVLEVVELTFPKINERIEKMKGKIIKEQNLDNQNIEVISLLNGASGNPLLTELSTDFTETI